MLPALHLTGLLWLLLDLQLYSKLQLCNKFNTLSLLLWETVSVMFEHPWILIFERKYAIYQCNGITCSSNSEIIGWKNSKESQNGTNVRINLKYLNSSLYVQNHASVFHLSVFHLEILKANNRSSPTCMLSEEFWIQYIPKLDKRQ